MYRFNVGDLIRLKLADEFIDCKISVLSFYDFLKAQNREYETVVFIQTKIFEKEDCYIILGKFEKKICLYSNKIGIIVINFFDLSWNFEIIESF